MKVFSFTVKEILDKFQFELREFNQEGQVMIRVIDEEDNLSFLRQDSIVIVTQSESINKAPNETQ